MALGMEYAKKYNADLFLATDPDCDRVGIAVRDSTGDYVLLSGNETGILLLDYICSQRKAHRKMPEDPVLIKTIVTSDMATQVADHYGVRTVDCLTGFKFIGEQIGFLEKAGKESSFIFGMEESYGYLSGGYVRDKDGVNAAYMICEMFAYYKTRGVNLLDRLNELYRVYGYRINTLHSYEFAGSSGAEKMNRIMETFRAPSEYIVGKKILKLSDYLSGIDDLPKSNVIKFLIDDNGSIVIRPSGTEPKLKIYISVVGETLKAAREKEGDIMRELEKIITQGEV